MKKKENKKPDLSNAEIIYLIRFSSYVTRFYDVIIRNSVLQLVFLTLEFQITLVILTSFNLLKKCKEFRDSLKIRRITKEIKSSCFINL